MESIWLKAKTLFTEEASQTLTTSSAKIADIVSETAKKSKDFAADQFKSVDLRQAVMSVADQISLVHLSDSTAESELITFGITDDLRLFVRGFTVTMFQSFPIQDDSTTSDVATVSNVRQDLSEWQQKHATLVLTTVKEISKLRYELCPRHMKDGIFWRIYFTLVSSHVAPYEKKYVEEVKQKEAEQIIDGKDKQIQLAEDTYKSEVKGTNLKTNSTSSAEQDLDTFLLGDLDDSDGDPDVDDETFVDDFDKIDRLDVEDEQ